MVGWTEGGGGRGARKQVTEVPHTCTSQDAYAAMFSSPLRTPSDQPDASADTQHSRGVPHRTFGRVLSAPTESVPKGRGAGWAGLSSKGKKKKKVRDANGNECSRGRSLLHVMGPSLLQRLAVGGGWWRLAVGGWWSMGTVLQDCPSQKKNQGS